MRQCLRATRSTRASAIAVLADVTARYEVAQSKLRLRHVFQIWLRPAVAGQPGHEQKRFSAADRRGGLCGVASLVEGEATLADVVLSTGDGAGITAERAVSLTAREQTEVLLVDLGNQQRS